jgi:hypothetical protein
MTWTIIGYQKSAIPSNRSRQAVIPTALTGMRKVTR